jgi:hypothetical protein
MQVYVHYYKYRLTTVYKEPVQKKVFNLSEILLGYYIRSSSCACSRPVTIFKISSVYSINLFHSTSLFQNGMVVTLDTMFVSRDPADWLYKQ